MIATWRRLAGVLVGTGFRAARWTAIACLIMSLVAAVASVTYSIGYRVMIDGATAHEHEADRARERRWWRDCSR